MILIRSWMSVPAVTRILLLKPLVPGENEKTRAPFIGAGGIPYPGTVSRGTNQNPRSLTYNEEHCGSISSTIVNTVFFKHCPQMFPSGQPS